MADDTDVYAAMLGAAPTDRATQYALASRLRKQRDDATMLTAAGGTPGLVGAQMSKGIDDSLAGLQQQRQFDIKDTGTTAVEKEAARHNLAAEKLTGRGQDLAYDPKMLAAMAAMYKAENPKTAAIKGQDKADEALALSQDLRELADNLDKNPSAVKKGVDIAGTYIPSVFKGALNNQFYTPQEQEIRANGLQKFQALQKAMDGLRPNQKMIGQTAKWAPFIEGDDAAQTSMKLRNAADFGEKQARAVLSSGAGLYNGESALSAPGRGRGMPPASSATRDRNNVLPSGAAGIDAQISDLRRQLGLPPE